MCIALLTTAHPDYALILINNRDEFLTRPTAPLSWHPDNVTILSGRDLLRPAHGTWLGITEKGLLAVLTNVREDVPPDPEARSRGEVINKFLRQPNPSSDPLEFIYDLGNTSDIGGFTMVFGLVAYNMFAMTSNRSMEGKRSRFERVLDDLAGETIGLSNEVFGEADWKKVELGKQMMKEAIKRDVLRRAEAGGGECRETVLIEDFFALLSTNTLPERDMDVGWDGYVKEFRNSIFIPAVGGEGDRKGKGMVWLSGIYGTQKQSIVLVDKNGHVTFVERTLYDDNALPLKGTDRDRRFEFGIQGWEKYNLEVEHWDEYNTSG